MSDELKPCPFCGGEGELELYYGATPDGEYPYHVQCIGECGADMPNQDTREGAVAAWNKRASDGEAKRHLVSVVKQLRAENERLRYKIDNLKGHITEFGRLKEQARVRRYPEEVPDDGALVLVGEEDIAGWHRAAYSSATGFMLGYWINGPVKYWLPMPPAPEETE